MFGVQIGRKDPDHGSSQTPEATAQTCIAHLLRYLLDFVSFKDRKAVATALKDIYRATDDLAAAVALNAFEAGPWGEKYPAIVQIWRRA